jgi:hypothetical protein
MPSTFGLKLESCLTRFDGHDSTYQPSESKDGISLDYMKREEAGLGYQCMFLMQVALRHAVSNLIIIRNTLTHHTDTAVALFLNLAPTHNFVISGSEIMLRELNVFEGPWERIYWQ